MYILQCPHDIHVLVHLLCFDLHKFLLRSRAETCPTSNCGRGISLFRQELVISVIKCSALCVIKCSALCVIKCSALCVIKCSDLSVIKCSALSVIKCSDLSVIKCSDLSVIKCSDLSVIKCSDLSVNLRHLVELLIPRKLLI